MTFSEESRLRRLALEKTNKWRYGTNRWFILGFFLLAIIAARFFPPVQPHIFVAPEKLTATPLFTLPVIGDFYLTNTLTTMIVADIIIILLALAVRNSVRKGGLIPSGIGGAFEALIEVIYNMAESTAGRNAKKIFPWFATIVIVVLISNWMGLIPGMEAIGSIHHAEEKGNAIMALGVPWAQTLTSAKGEYEVVAAFRGMSTDLNFTAALALIAVIAVQVVGFQAHGWRYLLKFFNVTNLFKKPFFGAMDFVVGLLELISEFSKILSFTFRLFGNMFAGMVLLFLITSMVPAFAPSLIMTFEFFIGGIQAFVFGMLTLVFMAQATQGHSEEHHE
jgi:F-type H+-transporting ATPase subunit a